MDEDAAEFQRLIGAVLHRFLAQNAEGVPDARDLAGFADRLWSLVVERGLPRPLAAGEVGEPGGMPEAECAQLAARVSGGVGGAMWAEAARQLVKACFYPEFTVCRDSYRAVSPDGSCRRQEHARVRRRVSGAHCVDCPHWVAWEPAGHGAFLAEQWRGDAAAAEFYAHREVFLPEDFRALARWRHALARRRTTKNFPAGAAGRS